MSTQRTDTTEPADADERDETDRLPRVNSVLSALRKRGSKGRIPLLAGGLFLARAARTATRGRHRRRRAGIQALLGAALLGVGVRRRRSAGGSSGADDEVSAEARAHLNRSDVLGQDETNPRGVSGETEAGADEGNVEFTTERDDGPRHEPELDAAGAEDPRRNDLDDHLLENEDVEVDLSEAAMADEASEATGPSPEQAYPAREGTDPEPHSERAPERHEEDAVTEPDADEDPDVETSSDEHDESDEGDERDDA